MFNVELIHIYIQHGCILSCPTMQTAKLWWSTLLYPFIMYFKRFQKFLTMFSINNEVVNLLVNRFISLSHTERKKKVRVSLKIVSECNLSERVNISCYSEFPFVHDQVAFAHSTHEGQKKQIQRFENDCDL